MIGNSPPIVRTRASRKIEMSALPGSDAATELARRSGL
jgi:hypothetical protein